MELQLLSMAHQFLQELDIKYELLINSIGDQLERKNYSIALHHYLQQYASELSKASQTRIEKGAILRILDSKDPVDL